MKIGIMVLSIGSFGNKGYYNLQEIGLAKALDPLCDEVTVYKLVSKLSENKTQKIDNTSHSTIHYLPSKNVGTNGVPDMRQIDKDIDALICFSDTQFFLPQVYRWSKENQIALFPYIGVIESHSTSQLKRKIIDFLFRRNLSVYKKCYCLVKTPNVKMKLVDKGVKNIRVVPVGLDLSLMKKEWEGLYPEDLKKKYSYSAEDKVLLFIGRMIEEKQPIRMIEILAEVKKRDHRYKLLMVGKGELKKSVENKIRELHLEEDVQMIEQIPNSDIWELYCFADSFVNLNQQEIFGMAILEAMYYNCKVVAWNAPGPNLIIEDGKSGWLAKNNKEVIERILDSENIGRKAHERILKEFTWESSARKILSIIGE